MQTKMITTMMAVVIALTLVLATSSAVAGPPVEGGQGSASVKLAGTVASKISYQGKLTDAAGNPLNGNYNLVFQLWDDATAGSQVGSDIVRNNVPVNNGMFAVELDVPPEAFNGQALWLRVQVNGQWLSPRQELLPVPYALNLKPGASIQGGEITGETTSSDEWTAAIYGNNEGSGIGVHARSANNNGLYAVTLSHDLTDAAVYGDGGYTHGVFGQTLAGSAYGVYGKAGAFSAGAGVYGESDAGDGVVGTTSAYDKSGVYGHSTDGVGVSGRSDNNDGVVGWTGASGKSGVWGHSENGVGVTGMSASRDGVLAFSWSSEHAGVAAHNESSGPGIFARSNSGPAAVLVGNVQIKSRETEAVLIELGEGLDYAEGFNVSDESDVRSGMVLVIDPEHPGKLTISRRPYDTRVAGIVTGAKGLSSAVRLGVDQYDHDVALAGRVYCNVDATYGEVSPGDLLTTSHTPGYAMVVKDYARAQGAILGKAMERLPAGQKGQILVLVTLQ